MKKGHTATEYLIILAVVIVISLVVVGVLGIVVDVGVLGGKVGGIGQVTCPPSIVFVESFA